VRGDRLRRGTSSGARSPRPTFIATGQPGGDGLARDERRRCAGREAMDLPCAMILCLRSRPRASARRPARSRSTRIPGPPAARAAGDRPLHRRRARGASTPATDRDRALLLPGLRQRRGGGSDGVSVEALESLLARAEGRSALACARSPGDPVKTISLDRLRVVSIATVADSRPLARRGARGRASRSSPVRPRPGLSRRVADLDRTPTWRTSSRPPPRSRPGSSPPHLAWTRIGSAG